MKKQEIQKLLQKNSRISSFRRKVYLALLHVPAGYVTTYAELGKVIGCSSAQAVGQALKHNPYAPDIPCHRVIKSNLSIGGFHGAKAGMYIKQKKELLAKEGVFFNEDGILIDSERVFKLKL